MNLKLSAFSVLAAALLNSDPGSAFKPFAAAQLAAIYPSESEAYQTLHSGENDVVFLKNQAQGSSQDAALHLCRAGHYLGGPVDGVELFLIPGTVIRKCESATGGSALRLETVLGGGCLFRALA